MKLTSPYPLLKGEEIQRKKYIAGQSLVEVLVGMATAVLIVGAMTVATISALQNAQFGKNENLATNYAQQGIEIVRNLRDQNYNDFNKLNGTYCLAKTCDKIDPTYTGPGTDPCGPQTILCQQNVGGENADIFVRQVTITRDDATCQDSVTPIPGKEVKVSANVSWYDTKCGTSNVFCHSVQLTTCLSTYNAISSQ